MVEAVRRCPRDRPIGQSERRIRRSGQGTVRIDRHRDDPGAGGAGALGRLDRAGGATGNRQGGTDVAGRGGGVPQHAGRRDRTHAQAALAPTRAIDLTGVQAVPATEDPERAAGRCCQGQLRPRRAARSPPPAPRAGPSISRAISARLSAGVMEHHGRLRQSRSGTSGPRSVRIAVTSEGGTISSSGARVSTPRSAPGRNG